MAATDAGDTGAAARTGWRGRVLRAMLARRSATEVTSAPDRAAQAGLVVWVPLFFSTGIGGWFALTVEPGSAHYVATALIVLIVLGVALCASRRALAGRMIWAAADFLRLSGLAIALVGAGFLCAGARAHLVAAPVLTFRYYGAIEGRVVDIDRSARDRMRITLDRLALDDVAPERIPRRVRISLGTPQMPPPPGSRIRLTGYLGPNPGPAEPNGFDFRRTAFFEGLGAVGYTRNAVTILARAPPGLTDATALRLRLGAAMHARIGGQEGAVAAALMTGDRSNITETTNQLMRDSNLYHIVSISGLHMSMLAGFVYAGLRLLLAAAQALPPFRDYAGAPVHKAAALAALTAASGYLWLSGGGVPTERAYVMVAVMLGAILIDRRAISLRTLAVAAMAILVAAPEALVTPGFQMSFAATIALIVVFPSSSRHADRLPWVVRGAALLVLSSLIAGLATAPIAAAHFNRSAQYGLVANLLVVPVVGAIVMPAGVIAALLAPVGLAGPALWLIGQGTRWMLYVAAMVAGWGGAVVAVPAPHWSVLPLGGGGALIALLILHTPIRPRLALAVAGAGLIAVAGAGGVWLNSTRPDLLIAGDGAVVGLSTPAGRALSKPAGSFVADSWLRADGDGVTARQSAARPGWRGERSDRQAELAGRPLWHLSGKDAAQRLAAICAGGGIVVIKERVVRDMARNCLLIDAGALRASGARAAWLRQGRLVWKTAAGATGARLWTSARVRRAWGIGGVSGDRGASQGAQNPAPTPATMTTPTKPDGS